MPKIRAVVLDLYGTLVEIQTNESKGEVFRYLSNYIEYYGVKMSPGELEEAVESEKDRYLHSDREVYPEVDLGVAFANILRRKGLDDDFVAMSCCKVFRALSRERFQLYSDSIPVLRKLRRRGLPLALLSDAQRCFTYQECSLLGIDKFFEHMVLSTHFGFKKPDPRLFAIACNLLNVTPAEAVYVGDNPEKDIEGARETGMRTILVDRGQLRGAEGSDFQARDLWEAWEWIRRRA